MPRPLAIAIYALTTAFFACFFAYPIWHTVREAFVTPEGGFTLAYVAEIFRNPIYLEGLANSFWMGLLTTILAILIALPLALVNHAWKFPGRELLNALGNR